MFNRGVVAIRHIQIHAALLRQLAYAENCVPDKENVFDVGFYTNFK